MVGCLAGFLPAAEDTKRGAAGFFLAPSVHILTEWRREEGGGRKEFASYLD